MDFTQYTLEIYMASQLISRQSMMLPVPMAIIEGIQTYNSAAQDTRPLKLIWYNGNPNEVLIFKNKAYLKTEEESNGN